MNPYNGNMKVVHCSKTPRLDSQDSWCKSQDTRFKFRKWGSLNYVWPSESADPQTAFCKDYASRNKWRMIEPKG